MQQAKGTNITPGADDTVGEVYQVSCQLELALALMDTITDLTDDMVDGRHVDPRATARRLGNLTRLGRDYLGSTLQHVLALEATIAAASPI